jgi:hypothetical protein
MMIKYKKEAATFRCRQGGRKMKNPVAFLVIVEQTSGYFITLRLSYKKVASELRR